MATSENPISARNAVDQDASQNHRIAYALFRLTLGLNIFFHGFIRIVVGRQNFVAQTEKLFTNTFLPMWQVHLFLSILPFLEVLLGLFLILGLLTRWALVGGALFEVEAPAELSLRNARKDRAQRAQVLACDRIEIEREQFGGALRVDEPHPGA